MRTPWNFSGTLWGSSTPGWETLLLRGDAKKSRSYYIGPLFIGLIMSQKIPQKEPSVLRSKKCHNQLSQHTCRIKLIKTLFSWTYKHMELFLYKIESSLADYIQTKYILNVFYRLNTKWSFKLNQHEDESGIWVFSPVM